MPRTLVLPHTSVKLPALGLGLVLVFACGGQPPPPPPSDPYAARVARCIDAPRNVSDAGHDQMVAVQVPGRPAIRIDPVPISEDAYQEFVAACGADPAQQVLRSSTSDVRAWPPIVVPPSADMAGFYCAWRGDTLATEEQVRESARAQPGLGPDLGFRCVSPP